ncbi:MAG: hypothetical protein LUQ66_07590 [Methanoregula sp.]|nr:hypothetical protein [Methanoregula sp.]
MSDDFTIVWVEDKKSVVDEQIDEIGQYLKELGFKLVLLYDEEGSEVENFIRQNPNIEIIVTDYNISEDYTGIDIIKLVRKEEKLIDILLYSVVPDVYDDIELLKKMGRYGFIEFMQGKDVAERLKLIIEKNIRRSQNIIFLRGFVISKVIDLELKLNEFFAEYFKIEVFLREDFHDFVLEGSYLPLEGKKKVLSKILDKYKIRKNEKFIGMTTKLEEIAKYRNKLAHCKIDPKDPTTLISSGEPCNLKRTDLRDLLNKIDIVSSQIDELTSLIQKQKTF